MIARTIKLVSLLAVIVLALTSVHPCSADTPFISIDMDESFPYNDLWYSCGDFEVWTEGVHKHNIKIKADEYFNILRNNAQTSEIGTIYNKTSGKYLVTRGLWTWNMFFEDNYTVKSVLAGATWLIKPPDGGVLLLDTGVEKYVGIYVNLLTGELIFTDPYMVAGLSPDYATLQTTICESLR